MGTLNYDADNDDGDVSQHSSRASISKVERTIKPVISFVNKKTSFGLCSDERPKEVAGDAHAQPGTALVHHLIYEVP